ncbi:MAG: hypothetical protein HQK49_20710 [Oligoflexia bacterium]|nr:hypothetical protein [Oligoflexia bacterium]
MIRSYLKYFRNITHIIFLFSFLTSLIFASQLSNKIAASEEKSIISSYDWPKLEIDFNGMVNDETHFAPLPSRSDLNRLRNEGVLWEFWLPEDRVHVYLNSDRIYSMEDFARTKDGKKYYRFFVHPLAKDQFADIVKDFEHSDVCMRPSASPRSFFFDQFMIKVSLPLSLAGGIKSLYQLQMQRATLVSNLLSKIPKQEMDQHHLSYLKESMAIYSATKDTPYGVIIREIPEDVVTKKKSLVPFFSLLEKDQKRKEKQTDDLSIFELNYKASGLPLDDFVRERILRPIIESFAFAAIKHGMLFEAHQQNTLFEVDEKGMFTGKIYYRDLDGVRIDFEQRKKNGFEKSDKEMISNVEHPNWVFDLENIEKIKKGGASWNKKKYPEWNNLFDHTYKTYIEDDLLYLLHVYLKQYSKQRLKKMARQILSETLLGI